jgi:hypothetical protein
MIPRHVLRLALSLVSRRIEPDGLRGYELEELGYEPYQEEFERPSREVVLSRAEEIVFQAMTEGVNREA